MKQLSAEISALNRKGKRSNKVYKPVFLRLNRQGDKARFRKLLKQPGLVLCDTIMSQIRELVKTNNPQKKFNAAELEKAVALHVGSRSLEAYGVWVYYPWSNRLVHLLDKKEFVRVRTSRNHYKITPQEQTLLASKKIGVVGLSVGQSVSVTLAMERICGELRLADFDILELTNLNRIRTGTHNLELPKVYSVAREIAEIDPFIKVKCFANGLNEKNMDAFFTGGGRLDLMVEESDGFDIKILSRYKARELKIPVLMEASDRCMVDVERFDLEPERDILHGRLKYLDIATLRSLKTTEEKIPYMLDVLGIETSSLRLRASMLEIEQSINTWPQLASAVTMGGGISADVARRILLNSFTDSGRYYVDIEEIIANKNKPVVSLPPLSTPLNGGSSSFDFKHYASQLPLKPVQNQVSPNQHELAAIINAACAAPSGGNMQPWRWVFKNSTLLLFNAFEPNGSILDYDGLASYIALGASIENATLQATQYGYAPEVEYFPEKNNAHLVAAIRFFNSPEPRVAPPRAAAIGLRLTNRNLCHRIKIAPTVLNSLVTVASQSHQAKLHFLIESDELDKAGDLLGELEKIRLLEEKGHTDFVNEMRWTEAENSEKRDGVDIRTVDLTNAEIAGFNIARDADVMRLINAWNGGGAFKRLTKKAIDSAGAVGVLSMQGNSFEDYVKAGQALESVWLQANLEGISFQPVSACLFLFARLIRGNGAGLSQKGIERLRQLRPDFERVFKLSSGYQEMFIFRLVVSGQPKVKSLRKPVEEVFCSL